MVNIDNYRQNIQQLLKEYVQRRNSKNDEVEMQTVFDKEQDHYQLIYIGWRDQNRIFGVVLHLDIRDSKIWIQWNGTEEDIGDDLVKMGVAKNDIVIGFQPPSMRKYTEYAIG